MAISVEIYDALTSNQNYRYLLIIQKIVRICFDAAIMVSRDPPHAECSPRTHARTPTLPHPQTRVVPDFGPSFDLRGLDHPHCGALRVLLVPPAIVLSCMEVSEMRGEEHGGERLESEGPARVRTCVSSFLIHHCRTCVQVCFGA